MSKTVFEQDFFLQNLKKNRSDVNGGIIILENTVLLQPFFNSFDFLNKKQWYILRINDS
jgi:hypothetical protein